MSTLAQLTLLGSGVLGSQIAWHSAYKGKTVVVYDIGEEPLERCRGAHESYAQIYRDELGATDADIEATRARLRYTTDLADAVRTADLVIEAVPEIPDVKTSVYREMAPLLPAHTLIATNSSTLTPSMFADATGRPESFCSLHFGNGIWAMNFAEVMAHESTKRDTLTQVTEFAIEIGMVPLPVGKEHSGYLVNTWFVALVNAAQTLVTNGIASPEDVDRSFMFGGRTIGPMAMLDQVGMTTAVNVLSYWGERNGDGQMSANARYLKETFVDKGLLGAATGQGYYSWPDPSFTAPDFLAVPSMEQVPHIVDRISAS